MFKRLVSRTVLASLLLAAGASLAYACANARALSNFDANSLTASDAPALLGPIDEHGRVGWECKPEKAAESTNAVTAELPRARQ